MEFDRHSRKESSISVPCVYHRRPGKENTKETLEIANQRAKELGIKTVLVASTAGETGLLAARIVSKAKVVVVSHSTGFLKPDSQQLPPDLRERIEKEGAQVLTCQHALGGVGRAVRKKLATYELEEIIAYTLRIFGEGTKVAIEIALMAADAGFVSTLEPCISVGGTSQGADTAILLQPAHAQNFFDMKILEILAKPQLI